MATTRQNAAAVANWGIKEITESYRRVIDKFDATPVVVGHSYGGLIAQKLLAQGYARAVHTDQTECEPQSAFHFKPSL